jgi:hypothetical protein
VTIAALGPFPGFSEFLQKRVDALVDPGAACRLEIEDSWGDGGPEYAVEVCGRVIESGLVTGDGTNVRFIAGNCGVDADSPLVRLDSAASGLDDTAQALPSDFAWDTAVGVASIQIVANTDPFPAEASFDLRCDGYTVLSVEPGDLTIPDHAYTWTVDAAGSCELVVRDTWGDGGTAFWASACGRETVDDRANDRHDTHEFEADRCVSIGTDLPPSYDDDVAGRYQTHGGATVPLTIVFTTDWSPGDNGLELSCQGQTVWAQEAFDEPNTSHEIDLEVEEGARCVLIGSESFGDAGLSGRLTACDGSDTLTWDFPARRGTFDLTSFTVGACALYDGAIPGDGDGDGSVAPFDCDDGDAAVYDGAPELCDAADQDCDGRSDEGDACDLEMAFPFAGEGLDLLFVVDNSGSMQPIQSQMIGEAPLLHQTLQGLGIDWRAAFVTTDGTGELRDLDGDRWLWAGSPDGRARFTEAFDVGIDGSAEEAPREATWEALNDPNQADFHRPDAHLAVIVISDEDDHSDPITAIANSEFTAWLLGLEARSPASYSALVSLDGASCPTERAGETLRAAYATGGLFASICEPTFIPFFDKLLDRIAPPAGTVGTAITLPVAVTPGSLEVVYVDDAGNERIAAANEYTYTAATRELRLAAPVPVGSRVEARWRGRP